MNCLNDITCHNDTVWGPLPRVALEGGVGQPKLIGWYLTPEEKAQIPDLWFAYPEPRPLVNYLLGILYIFFMFMALLGNGIVIWIFSSAKSLRTTSNMLVINLALCDFIMMLKTPVFIYNSFSLGFGMGPMGCQIYGVMGAYSGIAASASNAAIAYDRYRAIARPFAPKISKANCFLIISFIWIYATPWALMPALGQWGRFVPEGYLTSCSFDYLTKNDETLNFVATIFTFAYCIPLTLVLYFYSQIVSHVIIHEHNLREQAKKMNVDSLRSGQGNQMSAEIRIAKAAISICFLFVASWTPYAVVALIGAFGNRALITPGVTMIPACTCKAVACIDPYVYAISHPRFRLELSKRIPWLEINEKSVSDTASTTTENSTTNAPPPSA